jgi:hypothetical protein
MHKALIHRKKIISTMVMTTLLGSANLTLAAGYTYCSAEWQTCNFEGTRVVRYGADGTYTYKTATDGVDCTNDVFGDPLRGTVKACYISDEVNDDSVTYSYCSDEWSQCDFSGTRVIRYGANSTFTYEVATDGVSCTNSVFGDPLRGTGKACYYSDDITDGVTAVSETIVSSTDELLAAIKSAEAGSNIYLRGGTYYFGETISLKSDGTESKMITLSKYPFDTQRPLLDFSAMEENSRNRGLKLKGDYWHIYGIDVRKAGDNCLYITGSNNVVEFSTFYECADTGVQLSKGASNNLILNVDSYFNADSSLENADGFAAKLDVGDGNVFYGCRAWNNLDDGFDGYLRGADDITTTYVESWAIRNGYLKDGSLGEGDGNGFKTGGSNDKALKHNAIFINTIAAGNAVDGYDHNSNRGQVAIYNAIAHNNGKNINFSSKNTASKLTVKNTISMGAKDSLKASSLDIQNNSWQNGLSATNSDFVSVDIDQLLQARKPDGSLPDVDYFKLVEGSDLVDAGVYVGLPYCGSAPDIGAFESD